MNKIGPDEDETPGTPDRAQLLKYRISCCRGYLRDGAPLAMAIWYLAEIYRAEAELRILVEEPPAATDDSAEG